MEPGRLVVRAAPKVLVVMRDTHGGELTDAHPDGRTAPLLCRLLVDGGFEVQLCNNLERIKDTSATGLPYFDVAVFHGKIATEDVSAVEALRGFVFDAGKGLVVIHVASASFVAAANGNPLPGWVHLVGSVFLYAAPPFGSHHPDVQSIEVTVEDTRHPIVDGVPETFTLEGDELYMNMREAPYGDTGRLLATGTVREQGSNGNLHTWTEPIAFTLERGRGRVTHIYPGHSVSTHINPHFQRIICQSVEWAAAL